MMIKKVNINAKIPIRTIKPNIYGKVYNVEMSTGDILKCICARALVDEVLNDGSIIRLGLNNYNKDNNPTGIETPIVEIEVKEPVVVEPVEEVAEVIKPATEEIVEEVIESPVVEAEETVEEVAEVVEPATEEGNVEKTVVAASNKTNNKKKSKR